MSWYGGACYVSLYGVVVPYMMRPAMQTIKETSGTMNLGGSLTRQAETDSPVNESSPHIVNIGRMVEVSFIWDRLWGRGGGSVVILGVCVLN